MFKVYIEVEGTEVLVAVYKTITQAINFAKKMDKLEQDEFIEIFIMDGDICSWCNN